MDTFSPFAIVRGFGKQATDWKSLLALRGVGRESEAEGVRFGRRLTKVCPEVKDGEHFINSGSKGYSWAQMRIVFEPIDRPSLNSRMSPW
jgi:hypothetical protein